MGLVVNHNLMAANAARSLNSHYDRLSTSTRRLSSGLRIGSASDDAAGLAIRELMRSDVSTLQQGMRNANDAISLIQTADGALSVVDEKLIRMKELAEQAATGTYSSTQRLIIDSEYQAMASEITRIANSTDFNGIKLLDGTLSDPLHDGSALESKGKLKVHFGTGNDSSEDYYYITIGDCTAQAFGLGDSTSYADVIDRTKKDALAAVKSQFGDMRNAGASEQTAFNNAIKSVEDFFGTLETSMAGIFNDADPALTYAQYNSLFSVVGDLVANSSTADSVAGMAAIAAAATQPRVYGSKAELEAAAKALYEAQLKIGNNGVDTQSFVNTGLQLSALQNIGALYDNAIITAEGASVPKTYTPDEYNKLTKSQKEQMKVDVAMSFMNTMVNGSKSVQLGGTDGVPGNPNTPAISDTTIENMAGKGATDYTLDEGSMAEVPANAAAGTTSALDNFLSNLDYGFTQANKGLAASTNKISSGELGGYAEGNGKVTEAVGPPRVTNSDIYGTLGSPADAAGANPAVRGYGRTNAPYGSMQEAFVNAMGKSVAESAGTRSMDGNNIQTQEAAQRALGALDKAIVKKDNVRAHIGAMQNRLENTITNLSTQAENMQAAESRISDVDVATEMTEFVRNQILTQSAVAMLSQANSLPQMAMKLIGG